MNHLVSGEEEAVVLRSIGVDDFGALNDIYRPYSGRDIAAKRVAEALSLYPSVAATRGGRILGFCYCFRFAPDIIELANIFVARAHRQDGLGSKILRRLLDQICDPIQAIVAVNSALNETTEEKSSPDNFYLRNGFSIVAATEKSTVYWWDRLKSGS